MEYAINQLTLDLLREDRKVHRTPEEMQKQADDAEWERRKIENPRAYEGDRPSEPGPNFRGFAQGIEARRTRKKLLRRLLIRTLAKSAVSAIKHAPANIGKTFKHLNILGHHKEREDSNMKYYITQAGYEVINEGEKWENVKDIMRGKFKNPLKGAAGAIRSHPRTATGIAGAGILAAGLMGGGGGDAPATAGGGSTTTTTAPAGGGSTAPAGGTSTTAPDEHPAHGQGPGGGKGGAITPRSSSAELKDTEGTVWDPAKHWGGRYPGKPPTGSKGRWLQRGPRGPVPLAGPNRGKVVPRRLPK